MMAKTIEELEALVDGLTKRLTDKEKEIDGIQALKGKWSGEVGDVRKQLEDLTGLKDTVKTLTEDRDAVKKELEALKSKETVVEREDKTPPASKVSDKELADKLESELTDAEKKEVEGFITNLTADDKKRFVSDDTFRVAVLEQAKTGNGKVAPDSIWRVTKKKDSREDLKSVVADLFKKHKSGNLVIDERSGGYGQRREAKVEKPVKFG
jgi:chromosome segregation ATPase